MPLSHSAGLGQDIVDALRQDGWQVDVIVKEGYPGMPQNARSVLPFDRLAHLKRNLLKNNTIKRANTLVKNLLGKKPAQKSDGDKTFIYADEANPAVDINLLLSKIEGKYDAVITLFWHYFLTSESLRAVYDKLHCPIIIYAVDMAPITGGCFYFGDCRRMWQGCGMCPLLKSEDASDRSHRNFEIKKRNYSQMDCYFLANSWMNRFARGTHLFTEDHLKTCSIVINDDLFSPSSNPQDRYALPEGKDFVIMLRTASGRGDSRRKGAKYQAEIMGQLYARFSEEERKRVVILTVGGLLDEEALSALRFDVRQLGLVDQTHLIKAYRSSSLFLSSSVDDAGPSMVNQAMLCGVPVAAFEIGTAIDVITDGVSGLKAPIGQTAPIVEGILRMMREPAFGSALGSEARKSALHHNSYHAFAAAIQNIIKPDS